MLARKQIVDELPPRVDVIVLTWNRREDTLACLESLSHLTYSNYRLIVIDNGSTDGTGAAVRKDFPHVELIDNHRNLGFQGGFNVGLRQSLRQGTDFILVLNNDTVVQADLLDELMAHATRPDVGMLAPKIYHFSEPNRIWSVGGDCHPITCEVIHRGDGQLDHGQWSHVIERDFLVGCALLLKRTLLEKIGLFDMGFHPAYYEDADLCMRARQAGFHLLLVPQAKIWHKVARSSGGTGSPQERYLMARHSVRYFRKYVRSWRWLIVVPYRLGSACKTTLHLARHKHWDSIAAYWRGLRAGLRLPLATIDD